MTRKSAEDSKNGGYASINDSEYFHSILVKKWLEVSIVIYKAYVIHNFSLL